MALVSDLAIVGYHDEPVPNRFIRHEGDADHLAILLPGFGYTSDMPLFYYAENLLTERGADLLRVEYAYNRRPEFAGLPRDERLRWLIADAVAAYRTGLAQRPYRQLTLVGKSLGTLAMAHLLMVEALPPGRVRAVWLTPLLGEERVRTQITHWSGPSLFVIGTDDPHYRAQWLDDLGNAGQNEAVVIDRADHGLDVPGDAVASAEAVLRVVRALSAFLAA
jgi:predicted alpha/beta-hydrolase family hydrolase